MNNLTASNASQNIDHLLVRNLYAPQNKVDGGFRKRIGTYLKLLQHVGFWPGTKLFYQLQANRVDQLVVPAIHYPISLRKNTSDVLAFHQVFLYKEYDIPFDEEPRIIIDGGSNIGLFTILMKNRFPHAKVICLEPDIDNFQQLQKNVSAYSDIHCENKGIWHKEAKLKVWDKFDIGKWAMVVEESDYNWNVNGVSIGTLMQKYNIERIDVLKLDIESSEKELFSENYHFWLSRTKMIIIELHDTMKEGCAKAFFKAVNETFSNYTFSMKGENVILVNRDI